MDIYGSLFRSSLLPLWETHVRRRPVLEHLRYLQRTQYLSRDELHSLQSSALAKLIDHAYRNVPLYRSHFEARGLTPNDVRTPEDLPKLGLIRRPDLRARKADWASIAPPLPTVRKQTSGTTGEPLLFGFEPESEHWRRAVRFRGYEWAGYRPGDRVLHFWGAPAPTAPPWKARMKMALDHVMHRELYVPCAIMTEERLAEVVDVIRRRKPTALICYSQAGAELARFITRNGLRTWEAIPTICGAERVGARERADLEAAFGPVFDVYGCREVMMIAGECELHDGLHVSMENLVVEIVVTENGRERPARDGETGEVVLTDLHNFGMPFIRYANGDIATAGTTRRCGCGRTLPRIRSVQGRVSETLRDADGAAVSGIAMSFAIQDVSSAVRQFQVVQHRDGSVTIKLVQLEELSAAALAHVHKCAQRLLAGVQIRVEVVPDLPRSAAGKHHLVVVER
jgi:phenylacetate-CoA ligase